MENVNCELHGRKSLVCQKDEILYYVCELCLFDNEESLKFYEENFDSFKNTFKVDDSNYLSSIKEFEGFELLNKTFKNTVESIKYPEEMPFAKIRANESRFKVGIKEGVSQFYLNLIEKFEKTVETLNEKTDKLDLSMKSAKEEIEEIQKNLEEQIGILENEGKLAENFTKILDKYTNRLRSITMIQYVDPALKISFKKGFGNNLFRNGTNIIEANANNRTGSYWCECSNEVLEGPFYAVLKIHNITRKSDWSLNIGIQRATSQNQGSYYQDGCFLMCSGKITTQFQGNTGRNFKRQWNNGDEILIKRDENNNLFFALNNEDELEQAYTNIAGPFRICCGFSSGMTGDRIEFMELDN